MFIPDPDFIHIPDPTTETKEEGKKFLSYLFCSHKYNKIINYEKVKKKNWDNLQRIIVFLLLSRSSQQYGFGIQDPEKPIPDPGSVTLSAQMDYTDLESNAKKHLSSEKDNYARSNIKGLLSISEFPSSF